VEKAEYELDNFRKRYPTTDYLTTATDVVRTAKSIATTKTKEATKKTTEASIATDVKKKLNPRRNPLKLRLLVQLLMVCK